MNVDVCVYSSKNISVYEVVDPEPGGAYAAAVDGVFLKKTFPTVDAAVKAAKKG